MKRRLSLLPLTLAALFLPLGAGTLAASRFDDARSILGEPPPGTTTWILVSKPKKGEGKKKKGFPGLQLHATGGTDVSEEINPTTDANGRIADAHLPFCDCKHYHGTLFDKPDPDEGHCGWGCVIPFDGAPDSLGFLSEAIMLEERALNKIQDGDLDGAFQDLEQAKDAIQNAENAAPEIGEGRWDPGDNREYDKSMQDILKHDTTATAQIAAAQGETNPRRKKEKLDRAEDAIERGLKEKRGELLHVTKELGLGHPPRDEGD